MGTRIPAGVELRRGLDGALAGTSLVFLVKLKLALWPALDWRLFPTWSHRPFQEAPLEFLRGVGGAVGRYFQVRSPERSVMAETLGAVLPTVARIVAVPVPLLGGFSGTVLEQRLLVVGTWIAVLSVAWWWVLHPALFWWRDRRSVRQVLRGRTR